MPRHCFAFALITLATVAGSGCAHLSEARAIKRFYEGVGANNLAEVRSASSPEFARKALRNDTALQDFEMLNLPHGKVEIVDVEEKADDRKRVTVEIGEDKRELYYELIPSSKGKWVVDDVYQRQKKQGVVAYKSISEQIDLIASVREFVDAWGSGGRDEVLATASPEFQAALGGLPPTYLAKLTSRVTSGRGASGKKFRPQAQLTEDQAVVKLARSEGELVLTLKQYDQEWRVTDVAIDAPTEDERVPSVYKLALSVQSCANFLAAYEQANLPELKHVTTADFYDGCLAVGNLREVSLPASAMTDHELEVTLRSGRADFLLRSSREIVQINMHRTDHPDGKTPPTFQVSDVTLYDLASKQEMRLSALFTSKQMLQAFATALSEKDLRTLRHCSTKDLTDRVWTKLNSATIEKLPLEPFAQSDLSIKATSFEGSLTRIDCHQGNTDVAYLLREEQGRFYVDDIQWKLPGRPQSMKATLEVMIPVVNFASAIALSREPDQQGLALDVLRRCSSEEFNRFVWTHTNVVPSSGLSADTFLDAPLRSVVMSDKQVLIHTGDSRFGAQISLKKEYEHFVVDDVTLVAGPAQAERMAIRDVLRHQLSEGLAGTVPTTAQTIADAAASGRPARFQPAANAAAPAGNATGALASTASAVRAPQTPAASSPMPAAALAASAPVAPPSGSVTTLKAGASGVVPASSTLASKRGATAPPMPGSTGVQLANHEVETADNPSAEDAAAPGLLPVDSFGRAPFPARTPAVHATVPAFPSDGASESRRNAPKLPERLTDEQMSELLLPAQAEPSGAPGSGNGKTARHAP